jgi:hypothetical protein
LCAHIEGVVQLVDHVFGLSVALVGAIQNNASYAFGWVLNEDKILFHTLRFLVVRYDGFSYNLVTRTPQTLIHPLRQESPCVLQFWKK